MNKALVVIDVQHGLCSGEWAVFEARRMIERINHLIRAARRAGVPIVFVQHEEAAGLVHGSAAWQLDADLDALPTDAYVRKETCDSFHNTDLQAVLDARGVKNLIVCGLQSEYCVDSTVRRALALGYRVTLVADAHATMDNDVLTATQITAHHNETLARIESFGLRVRVIPTDDVDLAR